MATNFSWFNAQNWFAGGNLLVGLCPVSSFFSNPFIHLVQFFCVCSAFAVCPVVVGDHRYDTDVFDHKFSVMHRQVLVMWNPMVDCRCSTKFSVHSRLTVILMRVSVCLPVHVESHIQTSPDCLSPLPCPPLAVLQYVMYFWFCGWHLPLCPLRSGRESRTSIGVVVVVGTQHWTRGEVCCLRLSMTRLSAWRSG